MADPTFIHEVLRGFTNGITGSDSDISSEAGVLLILFLAFIGGALLWKELTKKPRPDPTLYMPDPPTLDRHPQRDLPPPASNYADFQAEKDKKDDAPWIRR